MTKNEAIEYSRQGNKITHRYFSDREYIIISRLVIKDESGIEHDWSMFWSLRQHPDWENDWQPYVEPPYKKPFHEQSF